MNFLISGANGYLGSRLVKALTEAGHRVLRCSRTAPVSVLDEDVISADDIWNRIPLSVPIDAVIHCATCYGRNGESDTEIYRANVLYGIALLEYASLNHISSFINIGTSLPPGISTYAFTKNQFSEYGNYFATHQKINFVQLILEHFYGPDENPKQKFIAMVIESLLQNKKELLLTPGEQIRDFIHISDVIRAVQTVLEHLDENRAYYREIPVGSGTGYQIKEVVQLIHQLSGSHTDLRFGARNYRPDEPMYSCADVSILQEWDWTPEISLEEGLKQIIKEQRSCESW